MAAELVRLRADIIVTGGGETARAARQATTTIPIVMADGADPVRLGLVENLGRPGGNVTGVTRPLGIEIRPVGVTDPLLAYPPTEQSGAHARPVGDTGPADHVGSSGPRALLYGAVDPCPLGHPREAR